MQCSLIPDSHRRSERLAGSRFLLYNDHLDIAWCNAGNRLLYATALYMSGNDAEKWISDNEAWISPYSD